MQVIIPTAGLGTRLRPHTYSIHKALMNVAGKPVLGHILDSLSDIPIDEVIFIVGYLGDQIEEYVRSNYDFPARFVVQEEMLGQAHAIWLAREYMRGPVLIVFADTIFQAHLNALQKTDADGIFLVKRVQDPRRFGVVVLEDGYVRRIIEKPTTFEQNLAVIGVYYVRDSLALMASIDAIIQRNENIQGEYYLADALQDMIDKGARFGVLEADVWEDCGKPETLLRTNCFLLEHGHANAPVSVNDDVVVVGPVHIAPSAHIERSVVGPYVTVCDGCTLTDAVVRDSIIDDGAVVANVVLERSLIGRNAQVRGLSQQLNVGDSSYIAPASGNDLPQEY